MRPKCSCSAVSALPSLLIVRGNTHGAAPLLHTHPLSANSFHVSRQPKQKADT